MPFIELNEKMHFTQLAKIRESELANRVFSIF